MRLSGRKVRRGLTLTALCLVVCVLSGCAMVGPSSISMGRADYNEAINRTEDEQLLLSIVKGRYGEAYSLLAVTGVAANVRFKANAGAQAGIGSAQSYSGNLVPFSAGLAYEENPTITYAPIQGEKYLRQLLTPIPLDMVLMAVRSMHWGGEMLVPLVDRINDLQNPDFLDSPASEPNPRFMRFIELFKTLHKAGVLELVGDPRNEIVFDIVIRGYAPQYSQKVREFLALLDLPVPAHEKEDLVIPAYFTLKADKSWGIAISTRSTWDLIEIMRASVEVPQEHVHAGLIVHYPPMGLPGQGIRIISSTERPKKISLAVKYRGYWFYIDDTDQNTKSFFNLVCAFWSISMASSVDKSAAPVLTLPVGR